VSPSRPAGAVVVMPRESTAWPTAQALWITARGWAEAAEARLGRAWIVTPDGIWRPGEMPRPGARAGGRRRPLPVPGLARTLAKDLRLWRRQRRFEVASDGPWSPGEVHLVWEHHDLFNLAGRRLASESRAPLVRYVHAPQVWEAQRWGVRRPMWGRLVERVELRHLRAADLVACVSTAVRDRLHWMGVDPARIVVSPMAVDAAAFTPDGPTARGSLGIDPTAVVVGWCGSFRPFHGLVGLIGAFAAAYRERSELHLLLVGDGELRDSLAAAARDAGVGHRVIFAGTVQHPDMPPFLRAMDVAVVSSDGTDSFHYSPLKLREYAACGRAVVAPAEGELLELREAGFLDLHRPGSRAELTTALLRLARDDERRRAHGAAARDFAARHWTWDAQLKRVLSRVHELRKYESR